MNLTPCSRSPRQKGGFSPGQSALRSPHHLTLDSWCQGPISYRRLSLPVIEGCLLLKQVLEGTSTQSTATGWRISEGLLWWASDEEPTFQCKACGFGKWDHTCHRAARPACCHHWAYGFSSCSQRSPHDLQLQKSPTPQQRPSTGEKKVCFRTNFYSKHCHVSISLFLLCLNDLGSNSWIPLPWWAVGRQLAKERLCPPVWLASRDGHTIWVRVVSILFPSNSEVKKQLELVFKDIKTQDTSAIQSLGLGISMGKETICWLEHPSWDLRWVSNTHCIMISHCTIFVSAVGVTLINMLFHPMVIHAFTHSINIHKISYTRFCAGFLPARFLYAGLNIRTGY